VAKIFANEDSCLRLVSAVVMEISERFYRNFFINSDNGRFSSRVVNTFSLEATSIKLEKADLDIRLYLKPKMPLMPAENPLPPRGDMHEHFESDNVLPEVIPNSKNN
jgi:hypothetical protein